MKGMIFTYILCYGGSALALFRPYYGFLVYVAFSILRPEALWQWSFETAGGGFSRTIAICLLVGWALNGFGNWKMGPARGPLILFAAFLLWAMLSALMAGSGMDQVEEYAKVFVPFLAGLTLINSVKDLKWLAITIAVSCGYLAFRANTQYYTDYEFAPETWEIIAMDSNSIAIMMVAAAGLTIFLGMAAEKWWQKVLFMVMAGLEVHVVLFSMSRGGMLSLICTVLVGFALVPKRPVYIILFVCIVAVSLRLAGEMVVSRFDSMFLEQKDASAVSRTTLWGNCITVMNSYPILGVGPNNWFLISKHFGWGEGKAAHTMWLQIGAEMGYPGLAFLALFYLVCVLRMYRYTREKTPVVDPWIHHLARMVVASLIGYAIAAQFLSVQGVELPYYIVLIGAGILKLQHLAATQPNTAAQQGATSAVSPRQPAQPAPVPAGYPGAYPVPAPYPYPYRG